MKLNDAARLSTRMFKTNPARTWLTILGMGVGISAVVMLVGLGFGLQGILLEQIVFGDTLLSLNVLNPSSKAVVLTPARLDEFAKIKNVDDVSPLASFSALMTIGDLTGNVTLQGVNPSYFRYTGVIADKGALFEKGKEAQDRKTVILSKGVLKLFQIDKPESVIGKKVKFRVSVPRSDGSGSDEIIFKDEYTIKGVGNDSALAATLTLSELSSLIAIPYFDRAQVKVSATGFLSAVQDEIVKKGFTVTALSKTVDQANQIFQGVQAVLAAFGGIALIVSAIGMFNTMTVTLLERTGEIGIMRTIGASPRDIQVLFLSEAVVVGTLGGLVGIGIGVGGGLVVNFLLNLVAQHFGGIAVRLFRYPIAFLLFIELFSGIVGFMTGIFPARRAAKLSPLDAIRYK